MTTRNVEVPAKESFKIGEVAKLLELEPYVLRYWETEFDQLAPSKTRTGQRAYSQEDVRLLIQIRALLYLDQYTIAGARRQLELGEQPLNLAQEESGLAPNTEALETLRAQCAQLQGELESEIANAQIQKGQQQEMAARLARYDGLVAQLQEERDELEKLVVEATDRLEERNGVITQLEAKQGEMLDQTELQVIRAELGADNDRLGQELQVAYRRIDDLCTERDALESHCDELSAKLRANTRSQGRVFAQLRREVLSMKQLAAN